MTNDAEFVCPRRAEAWLGRRPGPSMDRWKADGTCSHCGSLSPALFFDAINHGDDLGPTDKNYKIYVYRPNPIAGQKIEIGTRLGPTLDRDGKLARHDLTAEELAAGRYHRAIMADAPPTTNDKFYFQHLSVEERERFIALVNENRVRFRYPGGLYVMPFFCGKATPQGR